MAVLNDTFGENNGGVLRHDGNELTNDSTVKDPSAHRFGKPAALTGPGNTAIGFEGWDLTYRNQDGTEGRMNLIQVIGRVDDRYPVGAKGETAAGELELFLSAPFIGSQDHAKKRRIRARWDGIDVWVGPEPGGGYVPLAHLLGGTGVAAAGGVTQIHDPDGMGFLAFQPDGALVIYQNERQYEPSTAQVVWSSEGRFDPAKTILQPRPAPPPHHPVEPPPPDAPSEPDAPDGVRFNYQGIDYHVLPGGAFLSTLAGIFDVQLDASDVQAYHDGRLSEAQALEKFFRKVAGDNVSR